jgi:hypothetical protein
MKRRVINWVAGTIVAIVTYLAADAAGLDKLVAGGLMFVAIIVTTAIVMQVTEPQSYPGEEPPPPRPDRGSGRRGR